MLDRIKAMGNVMIFTDGDLKRLKEYINSGKPIEDGEMTKALLARLEAAEDVCRKMPLLIVVCNHKPQSWDVVDEAYRAWRKAAGRDL